MSNNLLPVSALPRQQQCQTSPCWRARFDAAAGSGRSRDGQRQSDGRPGSARVFALLEFPLQCRVTTVGLSNRGQPGGGLHRAIDPAQVSASDAACP